MPIADERVQARALFAQGAEVDQIADALGKSEKTIYRWRAADKRGGLDWQGLRTERRQKNPYVVLAILEDRFARLAERDELEDGAYADAVNKLDAVIHRIRGRLGDISNQLGVIQGIVQWAMEHFTEQDVGVFNRVAAAYIEHLKRGGS